MIADAWTVADPSLCAVCGRDSCDNPEHLPPPYEQPPDEQPSASRPGLRAEVAADVIKAPHPVEIVEGVVGAGGLTVVASESGIGKTFVLLELAAALSDAVPDGGRWNGRALRGGSVVYVSFEGDALGLRLRALRDHAGRRLEHVYVIRATDPLSPVSTRDGGELPSIGEVTLTKALSVLRDELATNGGPAIVLPIIDTIRQSMSGNENDSEAVSAYLRAVRRVLATLPGAGCILAHHAGWQDREDRHKRERGSSAWRGNCDVTLYLEAGDDDRDRGEAVLTLRALKVRDGERPAPLQLVRRRVELTASDRYGRPLTSCIIQGDGRSREAVQADRERVQEASHQVVDFQVLRAIRDHEVTSKDALRACARLRRDLVLASLARVLRAGWVEAPARQRSPYTLTPNGRSRLSEAGS